MHETERRRRAHAYENPRPEVAALVPRDARRILDLGCSSGAMGAALKARQGAAVVGIEVDPAYAADAQARLDRVLCADVETLAPDGLGSFDCVLAADVLEHLRDPWAVLARFAALLGPGGAAVVSLPNVRHWETFWQVGVRGTWPRRATGIFDRTHLRWFTLADAHGLIEGARLRAERVVGVARVRRAPSRVDRLVPDLPGVRTLFTFQHVLLARRP